MEEIFFDSQNQQGMIMLSYLNEGISYKARCSVTTRSDPSIYSPLFPKTPSPPSAENDFSAGKGENGS